MIDTLHTPWFRYVGDNSHIWSDALRSQLVRFLEMLDAQMPAWPPCRAYTTGDGANIWLSWRRIRYSLEVEVTEAEIRVTAFDNATDWTVSAVVGSELPLWLRMATCRVWADDVPAAEPEQSAEERYRRFCELRALAVQAVVVAVDVQPPDERDITRVLLLLTEMDRICKAVKAEMEQTK